MTRSFFSDAAGGVGGRPRLRLAVGLLLATLLLAASIAAASSSARQKPLRDGGGHAGKADAEAIVDQLSIRQLAGQRVVYSYPGPNPPEELFEIIRDDEAAGVIFFGQNVTGRPQIRRVIRQLQAANENGPVDEPLLMMTDQEGGIVRRIPGAPRLSAKEIGAAKHSLIRARQAGQGAGRNLANVGVNLNLAPVLGVFRQQGNFLDRFQRSFSMDPQEVAELGAAFIAAQQRTGVAATSKHFPGLGAATASQDTDAGPVTLNLSLQELRTVDEVPYPPAIAAGTELVMSSWAVYPALDPTLPGGLSPTVVQGELRGRLGFEGVTITDALEAGALQAFGPVPQRGVLAADAGQDLLLYSAKDVSEGADGLDALVAALQGGQLDPTAFEEAAERVLDLRSRLSLRPPRPLSGP